MERTQAAHDAATAALASLQPLPANPTSHRDRPQTHLLPPLHTLPPRIRPSARCTARCHPHPNGFTCSRGGNTCNHVISSQGEPGHCTCVKLSFAAECNGTRRQHQIAVAHGGRGKHGERNIACGASGERIPSPRLQRCKAAARDVDA
jgi:hypothetical protein